MTPLRTPNLELELNNNIAFMSIKGTMSQTALESGLDWMDQVSEANDNFNICVDIASNNFDDLSAARTEFLRVGRVLRHAPTAEKCAVLTDSAFLKNSAKVEGAVIPGLEINAFDLEEGSVAEKWLNDEPIIQEVVIEPKVEEVRAEAIPQPVDAPEDTLPTHNPWDSLDLSKVDI